MNGGRRALRGVLRRWMRASVATMLLVGCSDPEGPFAPSCTELSDTCGPGQDESCCASSVVPGGTYYRSYDEAPDDFNEMGYPATVSDFRLDRFEITVGRFRKFVEAGMGTQAQPPAEGSGAHAAIPASGWQASWNSNLLPSTDYLLAGFQCNETYQTWTDTPGDNEHKTMNCISWYEAMAFCIWDGGYLPTEAEWNYAATGGDEQRAYPWSSPASSTAIDSSYAVYGFISPAGVGSKSPNGDGRWGHADLAGNAGEWTLDGFADPYPQPCDDCAYLTDDFQGMVRGGSFLNNEAGLRAARRNGVPRSYRRSTVSARCARLP